MYIVNQQNNITNIYSYQETFTVSPNRSQNANKLVNCNHLRNFFFLFKSKLHVSVLHWLGIQPGKLSKLHFVDILCKAVYKSLITAE